LDEDTQDYKLSFADDDEFVIPGKLEISDSAGTLLETKDYELRIAKFLITPQSKVVTLIGRSGDKAEPSKIRYGVEWTIGEDGKLSSHSEYYKDHDPWHKGQIKVDMTTGSILWELTGGKWCRTTGCETYTYAQVHETQTQELVGLVDLLPEVIGTTTGEKNKDHSLNIRSADSEILDTETTIRIHVKGQSAMGWIPNPDPDAQKNPYGQYIFFGKYSDDSTRISGVFMSADVQDHGVFIIKAYPADSTHLSLTENVLGDGIKSHRLQKLIFKVLFPTKSSRKTYIVYEDPAKISLGLKANALNQKCASNNCKSWQVASNYGVRDCHQCWSADDLMKGGEFFTNWVGRNSYSAIDVAGIDRDTPFVLSTALRLPYSYCKSYDAKGICQCAPGWNQATDEQN
jgi:hypothetical protein